MFFNSCEFSAGNIFSYFLVNFFLIPLWKSFFQRIKPGHVWVGLQLC